MIGYYQGNFLRENYAENVPESRSRPFFEFVKSSQKHSTKVTDFFCKHDFLKRDCQKSSETIIFDNYFSINTAKKGLEASDMSRDFRGYRLYLKSLLLVSHEPSEFSISTLMEKTVRALLSHFKFKQTFVFLLLFFFFFFLDFEFGRRYRICGIKISVDKSPWAGTSDQPLFRFPNMFRNFLFSKIYHMASFDILIKNV